MFSFITTNYYLCRKRAVMPQITNIEAQTNVPNPHAPMPILHPCRFPTPSLTWGLEGCWLPHGRAAWWVWWEGDGGAQCRQPTSPSYLGDSLLHAPRGPQTQGCSAGSHVPGVAVCMPSRGHQDAQDTN